MNEGVPLRPSRRSVLAGLAALALSSDAAISQDRKEKTPERFAVRIEPQRIERRTDTFVISYETPIVVEPENAGIAQHIDVYACVLQRDSAGAPLRTIQKNIAFSRNTQGTFTLSPHEFLEAHEQLVELSVRAEADHTEFPQLFGSARFPYTVQTESSIPDGYSCSERHIS